MSAENHPDRRLALLWSIEKFINANLATYRHDLSLGNGMAGIALFYGSLLQFEQSATLGEKLDDIIDLIYTRISESHFQDSGLFQGMPGVGLALEQIAQQRGFAMKDVAGINADLDELVLEELSSTMPIMPFDLVSGLTGLGVYALSRNDFSARDQIFKSVYAKLIECSIPGDTGRQWRTDPKFAAADKLLRFPEGYYDLGIAHGNAGVIVLLAKAVRMGVNIHGLREELRNLTNWLLKQRRGSSDSAFGRLAGENLHARNAWCVGDAGVSMAIIQSGQALDDRELLQVGIDIGVQSTRRRRESSLVQDHGICHGSMGLSLIYARLFEETGEMVFCDAARSWQTMMLDSVSSHSLQALATYRGPDTQPVLILGVVNGLAGIGLALIDSITGRSGRWSNFLGL